MWGVEAVNRCVSWLHRPPVRGKGRRSSASNSSPGTGKWCRDRLTPCPGCYESFRGGTTHSLHGGVRNVGLRPEDPPWLKTSCSTKRNVGHTRGEREDGGGEIGVESVDATINNVLQSNYGAIGWVGGAKDMQAYILWSPDSMRSCCGWAACAWRVVNDWM